MALETLPMTSVQAVFNTSTGQIYGVNVPEGPVTQLSPSGTAPAVVGITAGTMHTQGGATALTIGYNRIDTSTAPSTGSLLGDGVVLPASGTGLFCQVVNNTANPIQVYGAGSDTINGVAGATGIAVPPNSTDLYWSGAVGSWQVESGQGYAGQLNTVLALDSIAAAGTSQATATALTADFNRVTTATAGSAFGVILPAGKAGLDVFVINDAGVAIQVYGASASDTIDGVAYAAGVQQMPGSQVLYSYHSSGAWRTNGIGEGYVGSLMTVNFQSGVTAAGTTQGTATQLVNQVAVVSTVAAGTGVNLPGIVVSTTSQSAGIQATIVNNGANPLLVYPPQGATSDTINGQASTAGVSIFPGTVANFTSSANGVWFVEAATTKSAASNTVASAASVTLSAANLTGGAADVALTLTGATTVTSLTTDTAANIVKALHSPIVGTSYKLRIINVVNVATSALTGGSGVTVSSAGSGVVTIPASGWREFIVTVTAVATPAVTMVSTSTGTWS